MVLRSWLRWGGLVVSSAKVASCGGGWSCGRDWAAHVHSQGCCDDGLFWGGPPVSDGRNGLSGQAVG